MTAASKGFGATIGIEGSTPGTFVLVAEVVRVGLPGMTRDALDATHLTSPNGYKEFIAGLKETGEASLTLNWIASATDAMIAAFEDEEGNYRITAPNGTRFTFPGFFTAYSPPTMAPGEKMEATVTIKATGKMVLA